MIKCKIPLPVQHRCAQKRGQAAGAVRGASRARVSVNWGAVLAVVGLFAAPMADAAIVFEEVVTGTGSSTSTLLPSIQGGSSQTYIVFIVTEDNSDVTAVSGGGMTWSEQKEQCGAADVAGSRVWTAQGSPGSAFQTQITKSGTLELTAVLVRYSGVNGFEGAAGENKNGLNDTTCGGGETPTAQLTLTSTQANTVHLVGVGMKAKTVVSVSAGYTLLGSEIQSTSKAYFYARSFASATTDQLQASLNGDDSWATAGLVLVPAGNTAPLLVQKTVVTVDDPVNGSMNPKAIPGANVQYTIRVTNTGTGSVDADTVVISDTLPLKLELFVNDIGGPGSGPALFVDGIPVSGLTYTFGGLGNAADDLIFDDGSLTFAYTPVPDANGYDANVTAVQINPKGVFNGTGGGDPFFELRFQARVL